MQHNFNEPHDQDNHDWSERCGSGLRQGLMGRMNGARRPCNTRRDRTALGDAGCKHDMFGQTEEEQHHEKKNWNWYQSR